MATWATIREQLWNRVERKPFWEMEELREAMNESLSLWNLLTATWKRTATMVSVAGQYEYVLPSTLLYRTRITFNGLPVTPASREELNLGRPSWRSETTTSGGDVPTRITTFAPISLQLIYLWPADAAGGGTIGLEGISTTPVLVEDGDTVDLGNEQMSVILGLAQQVLLLKRGGTSFQATDGLLKAFLTDAAEQNSTIKSSVIYRRVMGLDRRDLKRLSGAATLLDQTAGVER